jgi:hypothetical protein
LDANGVEALADLFVTMGHATGDSQVIVIDHHLSLHRAFGSKKIVLTQV